ncbi:MAG: preprotein translocase subunit YajC [Clostridia bacterium]|nr:preprotein translocase subunit YajC [Clostridia bacterium]
MNFVQMLLDTATGTATGTGASRWSTMLLLAAMVGVMYFIIIRPQKKKQKEEQELRDNLQIGDEITTIGGIVGKVVTIKEDTVVIETGADRVKLKFLRGAIQTNNTAAEKVQSQREAARKAAEEAKAQRKGRKSKELPQEEKTEE